ncbi:MAG: hypothetical protein Q9159_001708 [Coniocarpon cinnabarinum]
MPLKKTALLSSNSSMYVCWNCLSTPHSASPPTSIRHRRSQPRKRNDRPYATVAGSDSFRLHWPDTRDARRIPTPYQIFNQEPGEEYSKRRFYELVKIYHPDRSNSTAAGDDAKRNLERYRLIIAANYILSDPDRRTAYDRYGAGWASYYGDSDMNKEKWKHHRYSTYRRWQTESSTRWGEWSTDGDAMFNATWEDWETWYERQRDPEGYARRNSWSSAFFSSSRPSNTVFANNYMFLSLVAILAALGGIGQATRANHLAENRRQRMDAYNEKVGRDLLDARNDAKENSLSQSKEDRIKKWVRQREGYAEDEPDGRTTRFGGDFCGSNLVKDKDEVPFWKRPPEDWER